MAPKAPPALPAEAAPAGSACPSCGRAPRAGRRRRRYAHPRNTGRKGAGGTPGTNDGVDGVSQPPSKSIERPSTRLPAGTTRAPFRLPPLSTLAVSRTPGAPALASGPLFRAAPSPEDSLLAVAALARGGLLHAPIRAAELTRLAARAARRALAARAARRAAAGQGGQAGVGGAVGARARGGTAGTGGDRRDVRHDEVAQLAEACLVSDAYAVFVDGTAASSGDGTQASPFKTIAEGFAAAAGKLVLVCDTTYDEQLKLTTPVQLYGGFKCADWSVESGQRAVVKPSAKGYALEVDSVTGSVVIEGLELDAAGRQRPGDSSVAAFVHGSSDVQLDRVKLAAGKGVAGKNGPLAPYTFPTQAQLDGNDAAGLAGGAVKQCNCPAGDNTIGGAGGSAPTRRMADRRARTWWRPGRYGRVPRQTVEKAGPARTAPPPTSPTPASGRNDAGHPLRLQAGRPPPPAERLLRHSRPGRRRRRLQRHRRRRRRRLRRLWRRRRSRRWRRRRLHRVARRRRHRHRRCGLRARHLRRG